MGFKGKLIASMEIKCGGHLFHDFYQINAHHVSNISPDKVHHFNIHEGDQDLKVGSIIGWKYNHGKISNTNFFNYLRFFFFWFKGNLGAKINLFYLIYRLWI